ncbi:MAG: Bug family tripartite tricarboxylate transporter substrate binding protein [Pseudomonadota bacterium]|jgi:tripartite-type tricarboxylate transporter receptor subunit TctC
MPAAYRHGFPVIGLVALALLAPGVHAQPERSRPLRIIVPYPPGGSSDVQARLVAQGLSERLAQPVVVENRPGASAIAGTDYVARQPADGGTLLLAAPPFVITPYTEGKLPYDARRDFVGVSLLSRAPMLVAVGRESPARSMADLVGQARAQPGRMAYGSVGAGGLGHMATELLAQRLGLELLHVPYKGSAPALVDLAGGRIALMLTTQLDMAAQLSAGTVRVLATGSPQRSRLLPSVPTLAEAGLGAIDLGNWFSGLVIRAGTRPEWIERLSTETAALLQRAELRDRLEAQGVEPVGSSATAFTAFLDAEHARWAEVTSRLPVRER